MRLRDDAGHWRKRAAQARELVEVMTDFESRACMERVAREYDRMAERAVARVKESA